MMTKQHPLKTLIQLQKQGIPAGIYSACSANEYVLEACMERAIQTNTVLLIESTSNQVNQYGGYTNMKPADFKRFVETIAHKTKFPLTSLILGGDHLGPLTWSHLPEQEAMKEAHDLIREYVLAGFTKIHLDTSMRLADDDTTTALSTAVIARRGADLAKTAEEAYQTLVQTNPDALPPVYVVGSEVPIPGGAQEEEDGIQVTTPEDFRQTVRTFQEAFQKQDLENAWDRVIAVVVQPGVEFGDETIHEYHRPAAKNLTDAIHDMPVVFEGHSTDYQTMDDLKDMVEDGIAILKVGPGLTFALREGLFALAHMEQAILANTTIEQSHFIEVLDQAMLNSPNNWKKHYHGDEKQIAFKRKYSYSDRCRYYLPEPAVQAALQLLISNLRKYPIPLSLLSSYMPIQYTKVRNHVLDLEPVALLKDRVNNCIDEYLYATQQELLNTK